METKRKPGSLRLNDEQYEEMEALGIESESQYLRYKLNLAPMHVSQHYNDHRDDPLIDKLALQRAQLENRQLKEKLQELSGKQEEALNGVNHHVSQLLQEELMKRDFEDLKKENVRQEKQIEKLEHQLKKAEQQAEEKDDEIAELVRKLGIVELGKALLPGAVSGLAKRYPKQLQGLAETLGELGGQMAALPENAATSEEHRQLVEFAEYFQSLFEEQHLEEVMELVAQISQALKADETTLQKITYYLGHMARVRKAKETTENIEQTTDDAGI